MFDGSWVYSWPLVPVQDGLISMYNPNLLPIQRRYPQIQFPHILILLLGKNSLDVSVDGTFISSVNKIDGGDKVNLQCCLLERRLNHLHTLLHLRIDLHGTSLDPRCQMREATIPSWTPVSSLSSESFLKARDEEEEGRSRGSAGNGDKETSRASNGSCVRKHVLFDIV